MVRRNCGFSRALNLILHRFFDPTTLCTSQSNQVTTIRTVRRKKAGVGWQVRSLQYSLAKGLGNMKIYELFMDLLLQTYEPRRNLILEMKLASNRLS